MRLLEVSPVPRRYHFREWYLRAEAGRCLSFLRSAFSSFLFGHADLFSSVCEARR